MALQIPPGASSDTEGILEFQPAWVSTLEELPDFPLEWESTLEEPPSFIPEGDQESSSVPKTESRPVLKVKLPFHRKAKKAPETHEEGSTDPKDAPSQSKEVSSQKRCLEGQG